MEFNTLCLILSIAAVVLCAVFFAAGVLYRKKVAEKQIGSAEEEARRIINEAIKGGESKKREMLLEAKEEIHKSRSEYEQEVKERRAEVSKQERRLQQKEEALDKKVNLHEKKEDELAKKIAAIDKKQEEVDSLKRSQMEMLEKISGLTQEEASKSVGRSRPAIANAMRLLSLSKEVLPLVEDGTLSAGHARALLPISDPAEQLKAALAVIDGGLSVRKTEQLAAKTLKKLAEEPETESKTDALMVDYIAETEDYLSRSLARKVALEQKRKGGRIILEFYDSDDREALISNLARMGRSWEEIIK